jgi:hypothetical protein
MPVMFLEISNGKELMPVAGTPGTVASVPQVSRMANKLKLSKDAPTMPSNAQV